MRRVVRCLLVAICFASLINTGNAFGRKPSPTVDAPAPDFQVTTFDGRKLSLADFKGQVVVLNFWATWCGPCKRELPLLENYHRKEHAAGLVILAVATEDSLTPFQLRPLAKILTLQMVKRFKGEYGQIKYLPTNFVIDRKGVLRYAESGGFTEESIEQVLGPLLAETDMPEAGGH
ncbi:MAG TPA: redoxin domain-containing protein [Steroidobacteraceae bacterium]|nr:redoxin domain-containing protein [Steroidobacteraceae bacterium]